MSISTVKRKFASLIQNNLIKDTGKGLKIDWSELDFFLNIQKKIKTRSAGPGRKKNQVDTKSIENNGIKLTPNENQVDAAQNQVDTDERIKLTPQQNQVDTELLKDNQSILQEEIKKDINQKTNFDDTFFDNMDLEQRFNYKSKEELDIKQPELPENWLDLVNIK